MMDGLRILVADALYPPTLSTLEAAELLGCSADLLQRERGTGSLPVEPLTLGNRLRWSTVAIAEALGLPFRPVHQVTVDLADSAVTLGALDAGEVA